VLRDYVDKKKTANYSSLKKDQLADSQALTDDEKLMLQADIAQANKEAEEMKVGRLEASAAAGQRNREATAAAATEATRKATNESSQEPAKTAVPKEGHSSFDAENPVASMGNDEKIMLIKSQREALDMPKDKFVKAIQKRGGAGSKLADLTNDQLENLRMALATLLTKADLEKK